MDGPSGSGKSSVSRAVAAALGLRYLDTGAMYRGLTWWLLREGIDVSDAKAVAARAEEPQISVGTDPGAPTITVAGADVAAAIRTAAVTAAVSAVSAVPAVRVRLVAMQKAIIGRCMADDGGVVVEGRDIGTVVAPDAPVKMYLTASADARAQRRHAELTGAASVGATREDLARRDRLDSVRTESPLHQAPDAHLLDTTGLDFDAVVAAVLAAVRRAEPVSDVSR
ncbi:MAG: (d)CMP kinase [Sporichthyaceae bacterium]